VQPLEAVMTIPLDLFVALWPLILLGVLKLWES